MKSSAGVNPAVQAYLEKIAAAGRVPANELEPAIARKQYNDSSYLVTPPAGAVESIENLSIPGPHGDIRLRVYRPEGSAPADVLPALIYIHGGGWTIGSIETHDTLCRDLANLTPCAVVSIDYRLAPEHRFPIAVDECVSAARWVASNASELNLDVSRLAIGGDSAGGNLAAVVALHARDNGGPRFCYQLLIYPATDQNCATPSHQENGSGYILTADLIRYFRDNYLRPEDRADWRASPLLAEDHSRLPAAMIMTAGFDPLVDEGRMYAEALMAAGVQVTYLCMPDMIHGFIRMGLVIPDAQLAIQKSAQCLANSFR
jgi:acetyl esterase